MEEEKRKRRALEAGRELLENFKSNRSKKNLEQVSDEESFQNEPLNQSMDVKSINNNESGFSRDITYSSVSMSEGEGDADLEGLAGRVTALEELLQGKEAVVQALNAEIDHLRADASSPTSSHSQTSHKDIIVTYHTKLQEFELAINQRDNLIEDLTTSLQQALASRDALLVQINSLNSTQLGRSNEEISSEGKILALETALSNHNELVSELKSQLDQAQQNVKRLEIEKEMQNTELCDYKGQVENLNKKIRANSVENDTSISDTHKLQRQYEEQVEKIKKDMKVILDKFAAETRASNVKHENEMKDLKSKYEVELRKLQEENDYLKSRHDEHMLLFQSQLSNYKRTVESLKLELVTRKENHAKEQELLSEQIKLHKLQLEELTSKFLATTSVLESKESIEHSLQQALDNAAVLKTENESLKFKLEDLTSRYMAAQSLIENGQMQERTLSNKIFTLEKSLSRLSGISMPELDETAYQTLDTISLQFQQKLEEKEELEKKLVEKISDLENLVEITRKELESANLTNENYEKQIKDMKNMCDRLKSEMTSSLEQQQRMSADSLDVMRMTSTDFEQEILELKRTIEKRDQETTEYIKKLEELVQENQKLVKESEQLKIGLTAAYAQCVLFEEKLDQTLGFADSKLDDTSELKDQTACCNTSSFEHQDSQSRYNQVILKLDTCRKQLEDYEREKMDLLQEIEKKSRENKELLVKAQEKEGRQREEIKILKMEAAAESQKFQQLFAGFEEGNADLKQLRTEMEEKHTKEMEELRTYFEKKCLQMEKQYSEEVFSQQSRKMSDNDSEIEELDEDLYVGGSTVDCLGGGGGDASGGVDKDVKKKSSSSVKCENSISEDRIVKIAAEYGEKLEKLDKELQEVREKSGRNVTLKAVNQFCQTEQSSAVLAQESFKELNELRADYNRQLEEQVGLARTDIINALQEQIQALITVESESDESWPEEMLELRNKFTSNTKREIQSLKELHAEELELIKKEHDKTVNDLHEEIRKIRLESHESLHSNLMKERDTLRKSCATLRSLVDQLINYFVKCEEELNNTLISEVVKKLTVRQDNVSIFESDQGAKVKRVHFAPHLTKISSIVNEDNDLAALINTENDITNIFKNDLDTCLERLKADSARILNTSFSDSESWSTGDSPSEKLIQAEKLLARFQEENEHLRNKIRELHQRVIMSERKKEVISEGYGELDESVCEEFNENFSQLQERAKFIVNNGSNDTVYLLQLIDDLCRHAEKSKEEMRREKEDLQNQIEAADKQLRLMRKFQDSQAIEREAERDEAAKEIEQLQERLREREREKDRDFHTEQSALSPASSSADSSTLRQTVDESQMSESLETLTMQMRELEAKNTVMGNELKEAVGKIHELREVIRELEQQVQERLEREEILNKENEVLQEVIVAQTKNQQQLVQELEVAKTGSENNQLSDHIGHLQEELRKHQLSSEQLTANSSALKQLRLEIRELQSQLDRKTRELESLHVCGSSLSISQPSEDVSIREQIEAIRCPTPDDPTSPPILPLDHILKLKDTLLKHFRAEDVALKRLKDLEIQLSALQRQNEELLAEQDLLQQTISEQLFQIETLRARLEQQKQNAPFAHRQATSRLESQLYEASDKLETAERAVADKNAELAELRNQLERVSRLLAETENEIANVVQSEDGAIRKLKQKLEIMEEENSIMKTKLNAQEKAQTNLPQFIDAMLAEKNEEIDQLKEQLMRREKQLEIYLSLDEAQLRELLRHNEQQKNSARTLSDILSINSECEDVSEAIREAPNFMRFENVSNLRVANSAEPSTLMHSKQDVVDFTQAITETPKIPRLELDSHSSDAIDSNVIQISKEMESFALQMQPNERVSLVGISFLPNTDTGTHADELNASEKQSGFVCPRHDKLNNASSLPDEPLQNETALAMMQRIRELETNLYEMKEELDAKLFILEQRESELLQLQENNKSLNEDMRYYQAECEKIKDSKTKIEKDLEESENILKKRTEELETWKEKMQVDEKILYEESMRCKRSETALQERIQEITNLKEIISEKDITIETLQARNVEFENEIKDLYDYRRKFESYQQEINECQSEIQRLSEGLNNRDQMIRRLEEMARRSSLSGGSSPSEKDQEIYHLQEYLKEKDKVIRQMSDDSKSLHRALETIQNKMKESGNIVELRRKLKEERKNNIEMTEEIARLRTEVEMLSTTRRPDEDNDIAEMVQRELNLSARLDQQLLNVIDSEPEDVLKKCTDLKQANKEIDELNRIKDDLEIESEMLKSQITEYENRILQLRDDIEEKSARFAKLEEELAKERHMVRSLQMQLRREKNAAAEDKVRDTELISQLRIKLDEAFDVRDRLIIEQKNLEVMRSIHSKTKDEASDEQNDKEQLAVAQQLEVERCKNVEVGETLKEVEKERNRFESLCETLQAEREKLISNLEAADCIKDELKADLRRVREELKAKNKECDWHKSMLKTINDAETKRAEQRINQQSELKNLKRVMMDVESEMKALKEQLTEAAEHEIQSTRYIETLKDKEIELTEQLNAAKSDEKQFREIITDQQNELKIYLRKEMELADELKRERLSPNTKHSPGKILQRVKELNINIERLSQDKVLLYEKLARLREENARYLDQIKLLEMQLSQKVKSHPTIVNRNDSEERLQLFYGRYLRSESRRKALIYQKSYLFCIIAGYQNLEENTLSFLAQLTQQQRTYARRGIHRRNAIVRFRSAVLLIISIHRIKWLVLRWRTGRRVGANVVLGSLDRQIGISSTRQRNVSDHSPPVRERAPASTVNGTNSFSHDPYLRRFTDIRQNLHLRVPEQSTNNFKPDGI